MLKRIITAVVALIVFLPALIFSDTWVFPICLSLCAFIACYEMISCLGLKKNLFISIPIYLVSIFLPFYMRYCSVNDDLVGFLKLSIGLALMIALYIFGVAVFDNKKVSVQSAGLLYMSAFYIIAAFTSIVYLRDFIQNGEYIYLLTFLCAWVTDIFAYFTGRLLGKHKLIPAVSPKKTVEGAVGGVVFCVIALVAFGSVVENFFNPMQTFKANYLILAISGIFISAVSQIGDLLMSVIKRHFDIKDYGKIFPGHGGILDRFDSVLAVSLILAFICTYFNMFAMV